MKSLKVNVVLATLLLGLAACNGGGSGGGNNGGSGSGGGSSSGGGGSNGSGGASIPDNQWVNTHLDTFMQKNNLDSYVHNIGVGLANDAYDQFLSLSNKNNMIILKYDAVKGEWSNITYNLSTIALPYSSNVYEQNNGETYLELRYSDGGIDLYYLNKNQWDVIKTSTTSEKVVSTTVNQMYNPEKYVLTSTENNAYKVYALSGHTLTSETSDAIQIPVSNQVYVVGDANNSKNWAIMFFGENQSGYYSKTNGANVYYPDGLQSGLYYGGFADNSILVDAKNGSSYDFYLCNSSCTKIDGISSDEEPSALNFSSYAISDGRTTTLNTSLNSLKFNYQTHSENGSKMYLCSSSGSSISCNQLGDTLPYKQHANVNFAYSMVNSSQMAVASSYGSFFGMDLINDNDVLGFYVYKNNLWGNIAPSFVDILSNDNAIGYFLDSTCNPNPDNNPLYLNISNYSTNSNYVYFSEGNNWKSFSLKPESGFLYRYVSHSFPEISGNSYSLPSYIVLANKVAIESQSQNYNDNLNNIYIYKKPLSNCKVN
jgi:hypothetical protein